MKEKNKNKLHSIKVYQNKIPGNCLLASFIMILTTQDPELDPEETERMLTKKSKGSISTVTLLKLLLEHNFIFKVITEQDYRKMKTDNTVLKRLIENYLSFIAENQVKENRIQLSRDLLKGVLGENNLLIVNGFCQGRPHMFLITGIKNNLFSIADPAIEKIQYLTYKQLLKKYLRPNHFWGVVVKDTWKKN